MLEFSDASLSSPCSLPENKKSTTDCFSNKEDLAQRSQSLSGNAKLCVPITHYFCIQCYGLTCFFNLQQILEIKTDLKMPYLIFKRNSVSEITEAREDAVYFMGYL